MKHARMLLWAVAVTVGLASGILLSRTLHAASDGALLTGAVKSASGEKLAGVTVSAKAEGSTITTTVFTDEQGNYYFPAMERGKYAVWAQADTYETAHGDAETTATRHQDFVLKPMKDFERQLTGDQILASLPEGTPDDRRLKRVFRNNCTGCHQPNYILQNRFDQDGWVSILNLMRQINVTGGYNGLDSPPNPIIESHKQDLAAYLAKVRGPGSSTMKLKVRPRPSGDAALAVITEYDVPLDPANGYETKYMTNDGSDWSLGTPSSVNGAHGIHDAQVDFNGNIWYTYNVASRNITIGRIDVKTGAVKTFKVNGRNGMASGSHGMTRDAQGNLWFNVWNAGDYPDAPDGLAKVDPITEKIEVYAPPDKHMNGTAGGTIDVDGKGYVWITTRVGVTRFDPKTHEFKEFKSATFTTADGDGTTYGLAADGEGNAWWGEMAIDIVGHSDIESGKSLEVKLPPVKSQVNNVTPEDRKLYAMTGSEWGDAMPWAQGPRRMGADKNGNFVYICDYWGGNLAKIDIHTQKVTMIPLPRPDDQPYQAAVDSDHNVWVNLMNADEVVKYNTTTNQWTEYTLPTLGTESKYVSLLDRNGVRQIIVPYSRSRRVARMTFRTKEEIQSLAKQVQQQQASAR